MTKFAQFRKETTHSASCGLTQAQSPAGNSVRNSNLRNLLLGGVAASVAMLGYGRAAYAACVTDGTTITCTGDMSAGITGIANPTTTLNINSLTTNITPAATVDGIEFISTGDVTIVSDTGAFSISVTGAAAEGVYGRSTGAGDVSITHTGDITSADNRAVIGYAAGGGDVTIVTVGNFQADGHGVSGTSIAGATNIMHTGNITSDTASGIRARATDGITIASVGTIQASEAGIDANNSGAGDVQITHTGDITSDTDGGIYARSLGGNVTVTSEGDIQSALVGVHGVAAGTGTVNISHTGDITSTGSQGIYAYSNSGAITTVSTGSIQSNAESIYARSLGASAVSVTHTGDITSDTNRGIFAFSDTGTVTTVSTGNIQANGEGIYARSAGASAVSVTHTGDITSDTNRGMYALSNGGNVTTVSTGNIQANDEGIYAGSQGTGGAVSVTHTGDITSTTDMGIKAYSDGGSVTTVSNGNIQAYDEGIYARSTGASAVSVTHTGDIASATKEGILAQSAGSVEITLGNGVVQGATGAIRAESGTGTTLNLNAGSVLIGDITIGGAGAAVLNTGPGLSIVHTFIGTVPTIGDVSGNVAAVSVDQIAVADISGLRATDNQLSTTLDGVSGVLGTSRGHRDEGNWWVSAFGGTGVTPTTSFSPQALYGFGGVVAGSHAMLENDLQLGIFGGLSKGVHVGNVTNGNRIKTQSLFGGLYGSYAFDMFMLDFALAAGASNNDNTRMVANNTAATGLETATANFASFFLSPEFTVISAPIEVNGTEITPSVRIRYEALHSNGFTETGLTSGALTMGSSTTHALNIRLQGAMPIETGNVNSTLMARLGVDGRFATSSGGDATLLGVTTNAAGSGTEFSGGGFAGLDFTHALTDMVTFTGNAELQLGTSGLGATASIGIKGKL